MRLRWAYCGLVLLSGCATDALYGNASLQTYESDLAACEKTYPDEYKKPVKPRALCFNRANETRGKRDGTFDLVHAMTTRMLLEAEKFDASKLTPAEYDTSRAAIFADFMTKMELRANSKAVADAAQSQANAAWAANIPRPLHCTTFGRSTTCY